LVNTYSQALDYIYSFVDYSLTRNLRYSPEKFNLKRVEDFLNLIGSPQSNYKVVHVAGTKGKGSTCAMLSSIFTKSGLITGFYSSPHIIEFNERIRIGKTFISNQEIIYYINLLIPAINRIPELTTFEIITGLAFKYFADKHVDIAVIEVGLGGRFDATNVVTPEISVITSISFDHTKILGNSLKKIAFEKAGIIKPGIPVIVSKQKKTPLIEITRIACDRNANVVYVPEIYTTKLITYSLEGQRFELYKNSEKLFQVFLPLLGDHQIDNAVTAFACIEELKKKDIKISNEAIIAGFQDLSWPGRFEVINKVPLFIIDSAHNLDSFRKLEKTIQKYLPDKKIILIFGASEDKEVSSMLGSIQPLIKTLIITKSNHPRALEIYKIEQIAKDLRIDCVVKEEIKSAIGTAFALSDATNVIVAAGSIFIAGAVKENFEG
jgi:dihydrofolate synthase/folylpolyglutamate synthase